LLFRCWFHVCLTFNEHLNINHMSYQWSLITGVLIYTLRWTLSIQPDETGPWVNRNPVHSDLVFSLIIFVKNHWINQTLHIPNSGLDLRSGASFETVDDCMYLACSVSCINGLDLFVQMLMSVLYFCFSFLLVTVLNICLYHIVC
jgi:hypothetical protein